MNKIGFMSRLEGLLADIPAAEREEALQYYNDYFEDAGTENEGSVIRALGSPQSIADNIKAELRGETLPENARAGEHALTKYGEQFSSYEKEHIRDAFECEGAEEKMTEKPSSEEKKKPLSVGVIVLLAAAVLFVVFPASIAAIATVAGIIIATAAVWFGLIIAFGAAAFGFAVAAIALLAVGVAVIAETPVVFMALLGAGMLCGCAGILFMMLTIWMACKVTPGVFKGIALFWRVTLDGIKKILSIPRR